MIVPRTSVRIDQGKRKRCAVSLMRNDIVCLPGVDPLRAVLCRPVGTSSPLGADFGFLLPRSSRGPRRLI